MKFGRNVVTLGNDVMVLKSGFSVVSLDCCAKELRNGCKCGALFPHWHDTICCFGGLKHALLLGTQFIGFACKLVIMHHVALKHLDSPSKRQQIEDNAFALILQWFGSGFCREPRLQAPYPD